MTNLDQTLEERGSRYGDFRTHAEITQALKEVMQGTKNWERLADDQKEALEMLAHKVGRILNGDPDYDDSWVDSAGYMQLVANRLKAQAAPLTASEVQRMNSTRMNVTCEHGNPRQILCPECDKDELARKL